MPYQTYQLEREGDGEILKFKQDYSQASSDFMQYFFFSVPSRSLYFITKLAEADMETELV